MPRFSLTVILFLLLSFTGAAQETGAEQTLTLAEALQKKPVTWKGQQIDVSFAYGAFELKAGDNADIAMARADEAMYAQKRAGRSAAE